MARRAIDSRPHRTGGPRRPHRRSQRRFFCHGSCNL